MEEIFGFIERISFCLGDLFIQVVGLVFEFLEEFLKDREGKSPGEECIENMEIEEKGRYVEIRNL